MKRFITTLSSLATIAVLVAAMAGAASAAGTQVLSGDKKSADLGKLNAEISMLNYHANMPEGDRIISKELVDEFKVSPDRITGLMLHNLKYGDVAAIFAFAEHLPGGITNYNVNEVMKAKTSKGTWDQVASNFDMDTSSVLDRLSAIEDSVHREIKTALAESSVAGTAAGGVGDESTEVIPGETAPGLEPFEEMEGESNEELPGGATGGTGTYEGTGGGSSEIPSGGY